MPPASSRTMFRPASWRPLFQSTAARQTPSGILARNGLYRQRVRFNKKYSTEAAAAPAAGQSWFKRMWDSPIGLKTVHFWAPVMKWALVLAGIADFARPAEKLSLAQNASLTATGLIWTRWCLIIKPKNYLLAAVNFFLGMVGIVQMSRLGMYHYSKNEKPESLPEAAAKKVEEVVKSE